MKELKNNLLLAVGISVPVGKWLCSADLNCFACKNGMPTMIKKQKNPSRLGRKSQTEGGILQILYEHGLIAEFELSNNNLGWSKKSINRADQ